MEKHRIVCIGTMTTLETREAIEDFFTKGSIGGDCLFMGINQQPIPPHQKKTPKPKLPQDQYPRVFMKRRNS